MKRKIGRWLIKHKYYRAAAKICPEYFDWDRVLIFLNAIVEIINKTNRYNKNNNKI